MNRLVFGTLALAAGLMCATGAAAQDWRLTDDIGAAPKRIAFFVDMSSIRKTGEIVEYRTQTVYESIDGERRFDNSVIQVRGNCTRRATMYLGDSYYADGTLIETSDEPDPDFEPEKPNSVGEAMLLVACGEEPRGGRYTDPYADMRRAWGVR